MRFLIVFCHPSENSFSAALFDQIKDALYAKAAEKVEGIRPNIALSVFSEPTESESEVEPEEESTEND